jgi:hypothetical protein
VVLSQIIRLRAYGIGLEGLRGRWVVHFSPELLQRFHQRKRAVTGKWHVDETYRGRYKSSA